MSFKILTGDVLDRLADLEDESVQCVVTSPPYWGLRDYGVAGMIGLEPTLAEHMARIVSVFREVRRVLRADGTLWLNYGDCYSSGGQAKGNNNGLGESTLTTGTRPERRLEVENLKGRKQAPANSGLAAKQRLLMPARVALALQADGWWVRSEIVWAKGVSFCPTYSGSCMPSSVRDRPTDSHEMMYLLTKRARYFYDGDAVREANAPGSAERYAAGFNSLAPEADGERPNVGKALVANGRNLRTVWTINPRGYKEAHFATYPEALVKPCILAGTSERGACSECGAPWRRVVERAGCPRTGTRNEHAATSCSAGGGKHQGRPNGPDLAAWRASNPATTTWQPTCEHTDAPTIPCVVLDPFNGSGTTGAVAVRYGRDYVGIELNPEYVELAEKRIGRAAADVGQGGTLTADVDLESSQFGLFPSRSVAPDVDADAGASG